MSRNAISRGLILVAMAVTLVSGQLAAQSPYASDMQAGREAYEGSNFLLADRYFKGALENAQSDGQKATALYSLAVSALKQGKADEAKEHATKALQISPKNNQAKRLLDEIASTPVKPAPKAAKVEKAGKADKSDTADADTYTGIGPNQGARKSAATAPAAKEPAAKEKAAEPAAKQAIVTPVKPASKDAVAPAKSVETAAIPAPKPAEAAPAKAAPKPTPPAAERPASAPAQKAETAAKLDALSAVEVASVPATTAPVLSAGFSGSDQNITIVTGPSQAAEKPDQSIDMKRMDIGGNGAIDAFNLHSDISIGRVAVPQSGTWLASAVPITEASGKRSGKGVTVSLHVWDNATVDNKHAIEMPIPDAGTSLAGIDAMEFSRNGRRLVVAHRTGVEILDTNGLKGVAAYRFSPRQRVDNADAPAALALSGNGLRTVLTNGTRLRVTDGSSVRDIGTVGNKAIFEQVAITDDGKTIAASAGASVRFFDHTTGRESEPLPDAPGEVTALAFAPVGDRLAVASGQVVKIWSLSPRKVLVELPLPGTAEKVAFSADGKMFLAAGERGTRAWQLEPIVVGSTPAAQSENPASPVVTVASASSAAAPATNAAPAKAEPSVPGNAGAPGGESAKEPVAEPAKPVKPSQETLAARTRAANRGECEKVQQLDAEIGDAGQYAACVAKAEQQRRDAERAQRIVDRRLALDAVDCVRVKALDDEIGLNPQHALCTARAEQRAKAAERAKLVAEHKAALDKGECDAAKTLDEKLGLGDSKALAACTFQSLLKTGSARDLYLAAAKQYADKDRAAAKQLYRAIVDRFPQDDLAIKAAERMTAISDQEPDESGTKAKVRQQRR